MQYVGIVLVFLLSFKTFHNLMKFNYGLNPGSIFLAEKVTNAEQSIASYIYILCDSVYNISMLYLMPVPFIFRTGTH
jgi:hypothetical protein